MNFFRSKKNLKYVNYLDLIPYHIASYETNEINLVTVLIPKFSSEFAKKYIMPRLKTPFIKLKLDELGSAAWLEIDGNKKVIDIANNLSEKFGNKIQPVEERLTKFLNQLYEQKLITFKEIKGE
ncbi:PqqD family protein [Rosettibacter firmus]|uniref:PqqD family protein n=1 Tax=Rosettibacter firmus TaxID=3111522 RepID=UPI00336BF317